jgi:ATP-dependent Clp protease ATP-binding subunit ClpC
MREIASAFGLSHQRVHQVVGGEEEEQAHLPRRPFMAQFPHQLVRGRKRGLFRRFTEEARSIVVASQDEARALGCATVGTEHILLGVLQVEEPVVADVLSEAGLTAASVRASIDRGRGAPEGRIPFAPSAKRALELALREALAFGDNFIGAYHVLIAIAREDEGAGARILAEHGLDADDLRERFDRRLSA